MHFYFKEGVSGLNIDHLKELRADLISAGMGSFSPLGLFTLLDDHKCDLEHNILLEGCNINGARAVETMLGKRFTFLYQDGDWVLESIEQSDDSFLDGLMLTDFQLCYSDFEMHSILSELVA